MVMVSKSRKDRKLGSKAAKPFRGQKPTDPGHAKTTELRQQEGLHFQRNRREAAGVEAGGFPKPQRVSGETK